MNQKAPETIEIITHRPAFVLTRGDSIHQTTQLFIICGENSESPVGGKIDHLKIPNLGNVYNQIWERNKDPLWTILEHYQCGGKADLMKEVDSPTLRFYLLSEVYQETGLQPSKEIRQTLLGEINKGAITKDKDKEFLKAMQKYGARQPDEPYITKIKPKLLYLEKIISNNIFVSPIYHGEFKGGSEKIITNTNEIARTTRQDINFAIWRDINSLYNESADGKLNPITTVEQNKQRNISLSLSYIAREYSKSKKGQDRIIIPNLSTLEESLK